MRALIDGQKVSSGFTPLFALNWELRFLHSQASRLNPLNLRQLQALVSQPSDEVNTGVIEVVV